MFYGGAGEPITAAAADGRPWRRSSSIIIVSSDAYCVQAEGSATSNTTFPPWARCAAELPPTANRLRLKTCMSRRCARAFT